MPDTFTIEIAGLVTRVQPRFVSTREYCRPYLSEAEPEFCVEVTQEDLLFEQAELDREADVILSEGIGTAGTGLAFMNRLLRSAGFRVEYL